MGRRLIALSILFFSTTLFAQAPNYTTFRATPLRVIDGDTLELSVYVGLDIYTVETVRLLCVDTPEIRGTKAALEKPAGMKAMAFVEAWIREHPQVALRVRKDGDRDAYGRLLGWIYSSSGDASLNKALLDAKHAVLYMCGPRDLQ